MASKTISKSSREVCYLVVRRSSHAILPVPCAVFLDFDQASDTKDMYGQEMIDKGITDVTFELQLVPFYG